MKLSDAIMLGLLEGTTPAFMNIDSCAFGLALNAEGVPAVDRKSVNIPCTVSMRYQAINTLWPWTLEDFPQPVFIKPVIRAFNYQQLIWCWFDYYVYSSGRPMTMEDLIGVIRLMEPECGECCQHICQCEKLAAERAEVESATVTV